jgi:hypothetical protein
VTAGNISLSGGTGTGGAFKIGDTVTATWNDSGTGDNNTDPINSGGVTMNFSQFGGGSTVVATNSAGVWTASYTITSGSINISNAHVAVTATDHAGNATTTSGAAATVDDIAPAVSTGSGSAAFVAGDNVTSTPVVVDSGIAVSDAGASMLASATVSVTGNFHSGGDVLAFTNTSSTTYGDVRASYNASTGVLTLTSSGGATLTQWNNALKAVTFTDTAITPNNATRTIGFSVVDEDGITSNTATRTVTVTDTDQTPLISTTRGSVSYTAGMTPTAVDSGIIVSDRDNATLASATVSISGGFQPGDQLSFTPGRGPQYGNITASYDAATGTLTLKSSGATATLTQWQAALDSIRFATLPTASLGSRTISFIVNDGTKSSAGVTKAVDLVARPFAPPVAENSQGTFGAEDQAAVLPITDETASPIVLSELDPQAASDVMSRVQRAIFSNSSLDGGLLGLANSGSRTLNGIDTPAWLQPLSSRWSTTTQQSTEQLDSVSGPMFSITLMTPSARHAGEMRHTPAEIVVRQTNGHPLPGWMHYDAATGVLSGTAPEGTRETSIVVMTRDSTSHITRREIVLDFDRQAASGVHDGNRPVAQSSSPVSISTRPASKPSLAEQFVRQRAALHVSRHPQVMRSRWTA